MIESIIGKVILPFRGNPKAKKIRNRIYAALLFLMLLLLFIVEGFE